MGHMDHFPFCQLDRKRTDRRREEKITHITHMRLSVKSELIICPVCHGAGKVVIGYTAICTEPIEKIEKCLKCKGKGQIKS